MKTLQKKIRNTIQNRDLKISSGREVLNRTCTGNNALPLAIRQNTVRQVKRQFEKPPKTILGIFKLICTSVVI